MITVHYLLEVYKEEMKANGLDGGLDGWVDGYWNDLLLDVMRKDAKERVSRRRSEDGEGIRERSVSIIRDRVFEERVP